MRILFLIATMFLPKYAAATCTIPAGPLVIQKEKFNADQSIIFGCIDDKLEFVALESGSTYSWVSMGKISAPISPGANVSVQIVSRLVLANSKWASVSGKGKLIRGGWMAFLNLHEYAKIENGIVTEIISAKRDAAFPSNETWVLTPYDLNNPKTRNGRIRRGYRYKEGHFFPPSSGTHK
jgi:hypothetical protein